MLTAKELQKTAKETQARIAAAVKRGTEALSQGTAIKTVSYWDRKLDLILSDALKVSGGRATKAEFTVISGRDGGFSGEFSELCALGLAGTNYYRVPYVTDEGYYVVHQMFLHWLQTYAEASGLTIQTQTTQTKKWDSTPLDLTTEVTILLPGPGEE